MFDEKSWYYVAGYFSFPLSILLLSLTERFCKAWRDVSRIMRAAREAKIRWPLRHYFVNVPKLFWTRMLTPVVVESVKVHRTKPGKSGLDGTTTEVNQSGPVTDEQAIELAACLGTENPRITPDFSDTITEGEMSAGVSNRICRVPAMPHLLVKKYEERSFEPSPADRTAVVDFEASIRLREPIRLEELPVDFGDSINPPPRSKPVSYWPLTDEETNELIGKPVFDDQINPPPTVRTNHE